MLTNQSVEHIDQLLNELERQAQSSLPSAQFFWQLLSRLCFVLETDTAAVLVPAGNAWICLAQQGDFNEPLLNSFSIAHDSHAAADVATLYGINGREHWYAVPLRSNTFSKGCLIVSFPDAPPAAVIPSLLELLAAFSEVLALRQLAELEEFLDLRWGKLQQLLTALLEDSPGLDGKAHLVNQLAPLFGAARVSLATSTTFGSTRLEKVSGTTALDQNSKLVRTLSHLAAATITSNKPLVRQHKQSPVTADDSTTTADGTFANLMSLPVSAGKNNSRADSAIVIEWPSYDAMLTATASVVHVLPMLSLAWRQHQRWQQFPRFFRSLGSRTLSLSRWQSRLLVVAALAALAVLAYQGLNTPYPLTIEAVGTLEPSLSQTVFSSLDGYIEELLVEDGQVVAAHAPLARIRSPDLDLRIEELAGELRTIKQKRNVLQIASSQVSADAPDSLVNQNRLAAEVKQLDTTEANLIEQLDMLRAERQKSTIVSPIRGTVVAKDIKQQLTLRPLRRGDALFRVAALDGPWRLRIQLADKDSGYVLPVGNPRATHQPLYVILDSLPGERFEARLSWIANTVQNENGDGCFLEMHAEVGSELVARAHMGASARAYFRCGQQPLWFVWCRPLVEAAQRRLWFWS